jgi:hypothetical protein
MKEKIKYLVVITIIFTTCSKEEESTSPLSTWDKIKNYATPQVALDGYGTPYKQELATMGWEDGVEISKDGLHLYCTYAPGDLLSWTINSADPSKFTPYLRGPTFGMDLASNPAGVSSWIQSDILIASRVSTNEPFTTWTLSNMARPAFSEGAPDPFNNSGVIFTSNDKDPTFDTDIWQIDGYPNPSGVGHMLANFPNTAQTEDNPHLERLSDQSLVLFFDSDNYPGNLGSNDIWYSVSNDNADSWSIPTNVSSINTTAREHQPYLYKDSVGNWFLFFSAYHSDGKLAIFCTKQQVANNWDSWGPRQLVISAGNTAGLGEPSLTQNGDLSFVAVYENKEGSQYDRYDSDPWFLPLKK